jgi:hypothetical protein
MIRRFVSVFSVALGVTFTQEAVAERLPTFWLRAHTKLHNPAAGRVRDGQRRHRGRVAEYCVGSPGRPGKGYRLLNRERQVRQPAALYCLAVRQADHMGFHGRYRQYLSGRCSGGSAGRAVGGRGNWCAERADRFRHARAFRQGFSPG